MSQKGQQRVCTAKLKVDLAIIVSYTDIPITGDIKRRFGIISPFLRRGSFRPFHLDELAFVCSRWPRYSTFKALSTCFKEVTDTVLLKSY